MLAVFRVQLACNVIFLQITFSDMALFMVKTVCDDNLWSASCGKAIEVTY